MESAKVTPVELQARRREDHWLSRQLAFGTKRCAEALRIFRHGGEGVRAVNIFSRRHPHAGARVEVFSAPRELARGFGRIRAGSSWPRLVSTIPAEELAVEMANTRRCRGMHDLDWLLQPVVARSSHFALRPQFPASIERLDALQRQSWKPPREIDGEVLRSGRSRFRSHVQYRCLRILASFIVVTTRYSSARLLEFMSGIVIKITQVVGGPSSNDLGQMCNIEYLKVGLNRFIKSQSFLPRICIKVAS